MKWLGQTAVFTGSPSTAARERRRDCLVSRRLPLSPAATSAVDGPDGCGRERRDESRTGPVQNVLPAGPHSVPRAHGDNVAWRLQLPLPPCLSCSSTISLA